LTAHFPFYTFYKDIAFLINICKIAVLARDGSILTEARNQAITILENDPELVKAEHFELRERLRKIMSSKQDWSRMS
jgi:hypothetical protein